MVIQIVFIGNYVVKVPLFMLLLLFVVFKLTPLDFNLWTLNEYVHKLYEYK